MLGTCNQVHAMTAMIQIRNVPDPVHRTLKARAALAGKSLSDLVLDELVAMAAAPSEAELKAHLEDAEPFAIKKSSAAIIRRERDAA
jgi:plasmid stability protein